MGRRKQAERSARKRLDGLTAIAAHIGVSVATLHYRRAKNAAPWGAIRVTETNRYWAWADEIDRAMERASARAR